MYATHSLTCFFSRERHSSLTKLVTSACVRACMRVCVRASLYAFSNMFLAYRKSAPLWCYPPLKKKQKTFIPSTSPAHFLGCALRYSLQSFNAKFQCVFGSFVNAFPGFSLSFFLVIRPGTSISPFRLYPTRNSDLQLPAHGEVWPKYFWTGTTMGDTLST